MVVLKCGGLSRREKLLVTCTLPLEPGLRTRVWSFLSAFASWWPTCVVSEDDVEVEDGDRVLFGGRQYVDKELMNIGLVSKEEVCGFPKGAYVCRKQVVLRGNGSSCLTFSEESDPYSQCLVLAGVGGSLQQLQVFGVQRCAVEIVAGNWNFTDSRIRAPLAPTWDACTVLGGIATFVKCELIGNHSVMTVYPISFSGLQHDTSTSESHVILQGCVVKHGTWSGIHMSRDTSIRADRCVFLRNGWGNLQGYIETLHRTFCILRGRVELSNAIQAQIQILEFVDPQLVKLMTGETPKVNRDPDPNRESCVLKLEVGSSIDITNCQFAANGGPVVSNSWNGAWYEWRSKAPRIVAVGNVDLRGQPVEISNAMSRHERESLKSLETQRDQEPRGLQAWSVSEEKATRILEEERARAAAGPLWLE